MTRRFAIFLTPLLLVGGALWGGAGLSGAAWAQSAAAIVQQIHDQAYGKCMADAKFGAGAELQGNCSCSADVVLDLLSEEFKQALADGTQASFTGAKLKGGEMERDVALLRTCPKIGTYLTQQCAGDAGNPHCQILERALQEAQ